MKKLLARQKVTEGKITALGAKGGFNNSDLIERN